MLFIGDVHGKYEEYIAITETCSESIQVGDMGAGFRKLPKVGLNHRFCRGNHDSPEVCKKSPNWIPDGFYENGLMAIGGAWSIDWRSRIVGVSWWIEEELTIRELDGIINKYENVKPEVMVTHDCPTIVANQMISLSQQDSSRTRQALDTMFEIHKPKLWIAGHHHISFRKVIQDTEFILLAELEFVNIPLVRIDKYI